MGSFSHLRWKVKVKVAQSCLTLWPHGYTVHGILQARILEGVAFHLSRGSSQPRDQTQIFHIAGRFFTSWATRKAHEYWSGLAIPSTADLLDPGFEPGSPDLQVDSLLSDLPGKPKNSAVGSLTLLQQIFPTQESNQGFLHCSWILYQLSHEGSPKYF